MTQSNPFKLCTMAVNLSDSLSTSTLFNQLLNLSDRKNLCNVTIYCSNGLLYYNKLVVGLVFPMLEKLEVFNRMPEVTVIMSGKPVLDIRMQIDQALKQMAKRQVKNKGTNETEGQRVPLISTEQDSLDDVEIIVALEEQADNDIAEEEQDEKNVSIKEEEVIVANKMEEEAEFQKRVHDVTENSTLCVKDGNSQFKCNICARTFSTDAAALHASIYHCNISYPCTLCEGFIGNRKDMKKHIASEHAENINLGKSGHCSECNKTVSKLAEHTRRVHLQAKQHFCNYCEKGFYDKRDLERHIGDLHEVNREMCPECGLSFKRLKVHMKNIHTNRDIQKTCQECGKSFADVKDHMRAVHEKVKKYSCHICPLEMYKKSTLRRHLEAHEKYSSLNKPYPRKPKPEYKLENLQEATDLVISGAMSRRKAAQVFELSVKSIEKACFKKASLT